MQRLWFIGLKHGDGGLTIRSEVAKTYDGALAKIFRNPDLKDIVAYQKLIRIHRGYGPKSHKYIWVELNEDG